MDIDALLEDLDHLGLLRRMPYNLNRYITDGRWIGTGSRLFGYATPTSDFDFVVYRPEATAADDLTHLGVEVLHRANPDYPSSGQPLNFKVKVGAHEANVIVVDSWKAYDAWESARHVLLRLAAEGVKLDRHISLAVHTAKVEQFNV